MGTTISIFRDLRDVYRPSKYCRTIVLSIEPHSSSTRGLPLVRASKPSWPCAMYSLVINLYFLVPISLLIGSSSKSKLPRLFSTLGFSNQIPNRRFPGFRRESQDTRKPDIAGNRLFQDKSDKVEGSNSTTDPSWAGQVFSELSSASHNVAPSISRTTMESSNGRISNISPMVIIPGKNAECSGT
jgi:hypothetical protein